MTALKGEVLKDSLKKIFFFFSLKTLYTLIQFVNLTTQM